MTDKNKIIAEVERLKNDLTEAPNPSEIDMGRISAFEDILLFIDSLPEEPMSGDLEEEINRYFNGWSFDDDLSVMCNQNGYALEEDGLKEVVRHFAQWQKKQMMKDAIGGNIVNTHYPTQIQLNTYSEKFNDGDKVKVIIVKDD